MILVTGHKGFVGQHLTKELDRRKIPWIGYDLVECDDIRNKYELECVFELNQITEVIHLAALAGVRRSKLYPNDYISTNINGVQNIVDICNRYKADIIFYSSSSAYGQLKNLPADEDSRKNPESLYGITKLAGEHIVNNADVRTIIIRPFTVYGENGRKDEVIYKWLEQIKNNLPITVFGDGESCRGYVYVKDLVKSTIDCLDLFNNDEKQHIDFNLGGSEVIELRNIIEIFAEEFPNAEFEYLKRPKEDIFQQFTNTSKAYNIIGFDPKPNFEKHVRKIIKKFKHENKSWRRK